MTLNNLKTYLTTAVTGSGANTFIFGYLWEANLERSNDTDYPICLIEIPDYAVTTRTKYKEFVTATLNMYIIKTWDRNTSTDHRAVVFDAIDTIKDKIIDALINSTYITVLNPDDIISERIPEGIVTEWALGVKYSINVKLFC